MLYYTDVSVIHFKDQRSVQRKKKKSLESPTNIQ